MFTSRLATQPLKEAFFVIIVVMTVAFATNYVVSRSAINGLKAEVQRDLLDIARIAAKFTDGDLHQTITHHNQMQGQTYQSLRNNYLKILQAKPNIRFIYTNILKDGKVYFIVDANLDGNDKNTSYVMDEYNSHSPALMSALTTGQAMVDERFYTDQWGTFLSAHAPIFNSKQEFVATVSVDMTATQLLRDMYEIKKSRHIGVIIGAILALSVGLVVLVIRRKSLQFEQTYHASLEQLQASNQKLEEQQDDLEKAIQRAEEATRLKSEFLANMSHEIRTPLNGVVGMNNLLLETSLNETQRSYAQIVARSADSLLQLLGDILDFSKIEAGKLLIEQVPFDLHTLLEDVVNILTIPAQEKGLALALEIASSTPNALIGDPGRIRQILYNLGNNAIKFTASGRVTIRVCPQTEDDTGVRMYIEVEDSGIGIPEDKHDYIFNKFSQADSSTTRQFGGTGLGLAICKELSEMMGGNIGVRSTLGIGSTFWFTLRLQHDKTEYHNNPHQRHKSYQRESLYFPGIHVLLVEDNHTNQLVASAMLRKCGCYVTTVNNGLQALSLIKCYPFPLVLMDCQMPEMDGYEATKLIRSFEKQHGRKAAPIIAFTAHAMQDDREECLRSGMNDCLTKPLKQHELETMLAKWLPGTQIPPKSARIEDVRTNNEPGLDMEAFSELRCLLQDSFPKIIDCYLEDSLGYLERIRHAAQAKDLTKLSHASHTLKSSSMQIGGKHVATLAAQLEQKARHDDISELSALISEIESSMQSLHAAILEARD